MEIHLHFPHLKFVDSSQNRAKSLQLVEYIPEIDHTCTVTASFWKVSSVCSLMVHIFEWTKYW